MADLQIAKQRYEVDEPADAKKKWVEAHIAELKSRMFGVKQALDKCEQEIEDIRNGKMKKLQYEMIMLGELLKKYNEELNIVIIQ